MLTIVVIALLVVLASVLAFRVSELTQRTAGGADRDAGQVLAPEVTSLLEMLHTVSIVLDPADRVLRASATAFSLGMVRDGALAREPLKDLVRETRREGVTQEVLLTLPRGPVGSGRIMVHVRSGLIGAGRLVLLVEDRTAANRLEDMRRDFVANVSHELKTPVGAISLLAETMADSADDPDAVRMFAERMGAESTRLAGLVHDIIDLSRVQDATTMTSERIPVAEIVGEAVDRARLQAQARDVAIWARVSQDIDVVGDRALLVTAVRNLVDNAVRYSDGGTRVGVTVRVAEDELVEIAVVDQGIGIDADALPRVFERFYRVDPARSRETGGTGLGLSIVKHVAADHGGEVTVWSQPGRGSTFTLRVPAAEPAETKELA
ncbi:two-component system sensor histidine kinase SenX3 [Serinibacter salmoneus]|uniref:Sensor-like histidine kinase SenX3 n=1 Tax=Serinibacter salmoneus TaxID=556530 RepID=A0A2A9D2J8_9MICO|nr:two-component system sensor histidine kinase SenX3 [Serinibacter salmoneus]